MTLLDMEPAEPEGTAGSARPGAKRAAPRRAPARTEDTALPLDLAPAPGEPPPVEESAPAESAPAESAPAEAAPAEAAPAEAAPAEAAPAEAGAKPAKKKRAAKPKGAREPAAELPVARICVDLPLPHLDRPFDYLVPSDLADTAVVGGRVRVRFAGQLVDGYVLDRVATTEHTGKLAYLEKALSAEPVVSPEIARLARTVADRSAGTLADVLRLAVPPRHARAEAARRGDGVLPVDEQGRHRPPADGFARYRGGAAYLRLLAEGGSPRAVLAALPGEDWPRRVAEAVAATLASGRGAVAVVPDARDLERLDGALGDVLGSGRHTTLAASLGPEERYRRWLAVRRGEVLAVAGTRATAFAPVHDLGLAVLWDDGDDLHAEPRAPYCHARDVLLVRSQLAGAGLLLGGYARTAETQLLLETGWAKPLEADREVVRAAAPRVVPVGDDRDLAADPTASAARLPTVAWRAAREALAADAPVLVQVPRRGYVPSVACGRCRRPARCTTCSGPLELRGSGTDDVPACRWCGHLAGDWTCPECGHRGLRASILGARRTAEELGRAFPGVTVRTSGRDGVLGSVGPGAALVIATPGAEPVAEGGYGAALLLDTWALLTRADLRASEEALRRWANAVALVRPARAGGRVVIAADGAIPVIQALLRWDPGWHAGRELADRAELGFPPAVKMASATGTPDAVADFVRLADLPPEAEVLGPVPVAAPPRAGAEGEELERALIRVPRSLGPALATALHAAASVRSAHKAPQPVRVEMDPLELL
ncbi:primosomal protein N' [Cryptosporangium arvum]|uniref:Probable replication restart protein PriA n=1 Tax=Cryptosporangium arvum DSM 44712 TaxID=927661 RepID=A0A010ZRS9_9ACTN|nr:primosomal protein N' [Cryptosporangium arvum]EXG81344.1 primosomal protein N' (replication factor Y) - superfamily II helicase [Cryptosporangium arvum DSM 44712]